MNAYQYGADAARLDNRFARNKVATYEQPATDFDLDYRSNQKRAVEANLPPTIPPTQPQGTQGYDLEGILQKIVVENTKNMNVPADNFQNQQYNKYNPAGGQQMFIPDSELVQGPKAMPIPPQLTPQQQYQLGMMVNSINGKVKSDSVSQKSTSGDYMQYLKKMQDRNKGAMKGTQADDFLGFTKAYYADDKIAVSIN